MTRWRCVPAMSMPAPNWPKGPTPEYDMEGEEEETGDPSCTRGLAVAARRRLAIGIGGQVASVRSEEGGGLGPRRQHVGGDPGQAHLSLGDHLLL